MTTTLVAFFSLSTLCSLCLSSCDGNWKHALNFHTNAESKVSPCQESPAPGGRPLLPHIGQESREDSSQNLHGVLPTESRSQLQVANTCAWLYISPNLVLHPHAILTSALSPLAFRSRPRPKFPAGCSSCQASPRTRASQKEHCQPGRRHVL